MSRSELPADLAAALLPTALGGRAFAFLVTDARGRVDASGGELERFGLRPPDAGMPLEEVADYLSPSDGRPASHSLPRVQVGGGIFADVHRLGLEDGRSVVLMVDVTTEATRWQEVQQEYNGAVLAVQTGGRPDTGLVPQALAALDALALEELPEGRLRLLAGWPPWLAQVCGPTAAGGGPIPAEHLSPFLEHFLTDARSLWDAEEAAHLSSGPWSETLGDAELTLEATAVAAPGGRRLLLVRSLHAAAERLQDLLQRARDNALDHRRMLREIQKKEILLSCIVHDLKGPLTGMMGAFSMLDRGLDAARAGQMVAMGLNQARDQNAMIQDVLDLFAADLREVDPPGPEAGSADPRTAARSALDTHRTLIAEHGLEAALHDAGLAAGARVTGNPRRLVRVFANLLENAIRHAPAGTAVEVHLASDGDGVRTEVRDRGPGIPPGKVETIFRPRAQAGRSPGSAGLGLYYCRSTVERWGGTLGYEARPGGGSTFWFRLPAGRPS